MYLVANSNAMNGLGEGIQLKTKLAYWKIGIIVADCVATVGLAVWGVFAIRKAFKRPDNLAG